jgi:hypothetical protein
MRFIIPTLVFLALLSLSCEKKKTIPEGGIHIYLLSNHESLDPLWEIDDSTIVPEESPIIGYEDILSYDAINHAFKISSSAQESLKGEESNIHSRPFVLVADKE